MRCLAFLAAVVDLSSALAARRVSSTRFPVSHLRQPLVDHVSFDYFSFSKPTKVDLYFFRTGLYPSSHGIVANDFYDPALDKEFVYTEPSKSWAPEWWGGEPVSCFRRCEGNPSSAKPLTALRSGLPPSRMA